MKNKSSASSPKACRGLFARWKYYFVGKLIKSQAGVPIQVQRTTRGGFVFDSSRVERRTRRNMQVKIGFSLSQA